MCNVCVKNKEKVVISCSKNNSFYYDVFFNKNIKIVLHEKILNKNTFFTHISDRFFYQLFSVFTHNPHQLLSPLSLNK